jgi:Integrase
MSRRSRIAVAAPRDVRGTRRRSPLGHLYTDLNAVYSENLPCRALRGGHVGAKTRRERRVVMERALRDLHRGGFRLRRLHNLRGKHVRQILSTWRARIKPSTGSGYVSSLRTFCRWLQKPQLVELIDDIVAAEPGLVRRRTVTDTDRSLRPVGVNAADLLEQAKALDARYAAQLSLLVAFGLRAREAWLFRPHLGLEMAREQGAVRLEWGTKGGRSRVLQRPITHEHLAVLEWACTFAQSRSESMVPPGWSLQRWRRRFYYLNERIGLTRKLLGVASHAFRHGEMLDLYHWLTGHPAPARGGTLAQTDPQADRAAREIVSAHAGHADIYITSAYLGGRRPRKESSGHAEEAASSSSIPPGPGTSKPVEAQK